MLKRLIQASALSLALPVMVWAAPSQTSTPSTAKTVVKAPAPKMPAKALKTNDADSSPATAEPEPTPDPQVAKARSESQKLRDAWDHARLESTVYDKRYHRAYDRWVKAAKEGKITAMKKRDQAMVELKISLERRRLAWYEWELAKSKQVALEAQTKAKGLREDIQRVKQRIEGLGGAWKSTPVPTKTNGVSL
jgi:hypothetical protein